MSRSSHRYRLSTFAVCTVFALTTAEARNPRRRVVTPLTPTAYTAPINPANANAPSDMLGTFYSTPTLFVRGDGPTGSGYSPLGQYGTSNLNTYGPISSYRSVSAPVRIYSRGYDGVVTETEGVTTSNPYLPRPQPVNYPNANSNYFKPRRLTSPPWWQSGINWVDQN